MCSDSLWPCTCLRGERSPAAFWGGWYLRWIFTSMYSCTMFHYLEISLKMPGGIIISVINYSPSQGSLIACSHASIYNADSEQSTNIISPQESRCIAFVQLARVWKKLDGSLLQWILSYKYISILLSSSLALRASAERLTTLSHYLTFYSASVCFFPRCFLMQ